MAKKALVLLAGCGAMDGAEIHESVLTLLNLNLNGIDYQCAAPNKKQHHVINFLNGSEMNEERNILTEAARIARGDILDLAEIKIHEYDALVIPGGFGVAKNFCNFAFEGINASADPKLQNIIQTAFQAKKPILAICISPALIALSLQELNSESNPISLSLGTDETSQAGLDHLGYDSQPCLTTECIVDTHNKIICTPAYMHGDSQIKELNQGIAKAVAALTKLF